MPAAAANDSAQQVFLQQDLDALLDRRLDRVVPFLDWTYGWAASYTNSFVIVVRVAASIWQGSDSWIDTASDIVRDNQLRSLQSRVLRPNNDATQVSALIDRHVSSRLFANGARLLADICPSKIGVTCSSPSTKEFEAYAATVLAARRSPTAKATEINEIEQLLDVSSAVAVDYVHPLRPLVSRIIVFVLRLTELTSLVVLITTGLRRIYVPNTAFIRIIITFGIAWGLDYCILRAERAMNESAFEAQIIRQLDAQKTAVVAYAKANIEAAEAAVAQKAGIPFEGVKPWH